jgi:hypothetical protein
VRLQLTHARSTMRLLSAPAAAHRSDGRRAHAYR